MSSVPLSSRSQELSDRWGWHLSVLVILICLILANFRYEAISAIEVWWVYDTYSHCFLILPISAWLVWQKRDELKTLPPSICRIAVLGIPPLLLVWFLGKLTTINEVRQFAVVGLIEVAILMTVGTQIYRALLFPSLYLFFLVPFGQYFIPPMQEFAAWFTDVGLLLLKVPHFTEGTLIELPSSRPAASK
jgi:exosortase